MEPQTGTAASAPVPPPPSTANVVPTRSPKRVRLNPAQKAAVCELLAGGARPDYIVDTFGIAKRTVFKIQRAQRLALAAAQADQDPSKKEPVVASQQQSLPSNDAQPHGSPTQILESSGQALRNGTQLEQSIAAAAGQVTTDENGNLIPTALAGNSEAPGGATASASGAHNGITGRQPPKKPAPPAKRVRLNVSEKLEICNFVQSGGTPLAVINKYGISRRTFFKIIHDEPCIRQTVEREHISADTKSIRPPHFPRLDQALSSFVLSARAARVPLNWHMVREQALKLRSELLASGKERPERIPHLERFTASEHWCQLFLRKNANKKLPSMIEDPAPGRRQVAKETKNLQAQLARFDSENIYTLITPRLFYRYTPPNFFVDDNGKKEDGVNEESGGDANEPYITLLIAANMSGTKRLPVTIIVPPNMQQNFDMRKPCLGYQCRIMQRFDSVAMDQWLRESFIPFIMTNNPNKVALVVEESVAMSSTFMDPTQHISFLSVPRACMSMQESVKNGIFPLLVARYRFKLYELYSALVPMRKELREFSERVPKQFRGVGEGHDVNIWDAAQLVCDSWNEISAERIARCWWRYNILPPVLESQLQQLYGVATDVPAIHEISNFVLQIARSNGLGKGSHDISLPQGQFGSKTRWLTVVEIVRWFTFEYQQQGTMKPDHPSENGLDWNGPPVITDVSNDMMEDAGEARRLTSEEFIEAMKHYGNLERSLFETRDLEALNFLRASKQATLTNYVFPTVGPPKQDPVVPPFQNISPPKQDSIVSPFQNISPSKQDSVVPSANPFQNLSPPKQDNGIPNTNPFQSLSPPKQDTVAPVANFTFQNVGTSKQESSNFSFQNVGSTKPDNGEQ